MAASSTKCERISSRLTPVFRIMLPVALTFIVGMSWWAAFNQAALDIPTISLVISGGVVLALCQFTMRFRSVYICGSLIITAGLRGVCVFNGSEIDGIGRFPAQGLSIIRVTIRQESRISVKRIWFIADARFGKWQDNPAMIALRRVTTSSV